jgi:hypothetical protein
MCKAREGHSEGILGQQQCHMGQLVLIFGGKKIYVEAESIENFK